MKTAEKILHTIKRDGAVSAKQIAEQFGMTTMGARQHLQSLEKDGILETFDIKVKVGRPSRNWALTDKGNEQFSDRHGELTIQMIEAVGNLFGQDGLQKVVQQRETQTLKNYQKALVNTDSLEEKLSVLAKLRESEGYMVEIETTEFGYRFIENHCPICRAATHCQSFCQSELSVFKLLLKNDASIEREEHIISGQRRCSYIVTPHEKPSQ
ncbi:helix-turn-helix transcriptional regulator [Vibrio sp. WJH972]